MKLYLAFLAAPIAFAELSTRDDGTKNVWKVVRQDDGKPYFWLQGGQTTSWDNPSKPLELAGEWAFGPLGVWNLSQSGTQLSANVSGYLGMGVILLDKKEKGKMIWQWPISSPWSGRYNATISKDLLTIDFSPFPVQWTRQTIHRSDTPDISGNWDVPTPLRTAVEVKPQAHIVQRGIMFECTLNDIVGSGFVQDSNTMVITWPHGTPYQGRYEGKIAEDGLSIKFAAAAWLRPGVKERERLCTLRQLWDGENEGVACFHCKCTPNMNGWSAEKVMAFAFGTYAFTFSLLCALFAILPRIPGCADGIDSHTEPLEDISSLGNGRDVGAATGSRKLLSSLQFPRFVAAVHIFVMHYQGGWGAWTAWGYTWVPYFFMLTGYLQARGRVSGPLREESTLQFVADRLATLLPLHLFALLITAIVKPIFFGLPIFNCPFVGSTTSSLVTIMMLIHAWLPCGGAGYPWNVPSWFLSCLHLYSWLFFPALRIVRQLTVKGCAIALCICFAWGAWPEVVSRCLGVNTFNPADVVSASFRLASTTHPFSFFQHFLAGMVIARGLELGASIHFPKHSASCASFALVVLFNTNPYYAYLAWEHGAMLPLHVLLIVGLTTGNDPICKILENPMLVHLGDYAFGIYVLQNTGLFLGQTYLSFLFFSNNVALIIQPAILAALCIVGHHFVEKPSRNFWTAFKKKRDRAKIEKQSPCDDEDEELVSFIQNEKDTEIL